MLCYFCNTNMEKERKVTVSLTSFPGAIDYVPAAIRSILSGRVLPDRIVLYVTMEQFGEAGLPEAVKGLERDCDIFEVRDYPRDIRSYRKLVPALRDFPEDIIVTIDDDVAYHPDMLAGLLRMNEKFPDDVIAHRAKRILPEKPYRKWWKYRWYHFLPRRFHLRFDTMQTGVGGVLYPPHSLKEDMMDEALFMQTAPTTDDIWFWAAAVANGHRVIPVPFGRNKPKGIGKPSELSLKKYNFKGNVDRNKANFDAITALFPDVKRRIEDEKADR